jgi:hypothetical protein
VTERESELRLRIMRAFAATGAPPEIGAADREPLRALADRHVVALAGDDGGQIHMAHPFAAHGAGARVESRDRAPGTWWGNCAWDGLGIVALLGLTDATVTSNGITLRIEDGALRDSALFHVAVPARAWWDDIGYT